MFAIYTIYMANTYYNYDIYFHFFFFVYIALLIPLSQTPERENLQKHIF